MPAHAHTLPRLPLSYVWSYGVNSPRNPQGGGGIRFQSEAVTLLDGSRG